METLECVRYRFTTKIHIVENVLETVAFFSLVSDSYKNFSNISRIFIAKSWIQNRRRSLVSFAFCVSNQVLSLFIAEDAKLFKKKKFNAKL